MIPVLRALSIGIMVTAGVGVARAQESFADLETVHFQIRYQEGIGAAGARTVSEYLEQDFGYLRNVLGLEPGGKIEVRLYQRETGLKSATGNRHASDIEVKRGVLHVAPVPLLEAKGRLSRTLSFGLSLAMLEQSLTNGAPNWLVHSFAVYHSGFMADLSPPAGHRVSYFSDLDQELQGATASADREGVRYLLGMTMKFLVDSYGEEKAFRLFAAFDGTTPVEVAFDKTLNRSYEQVERSWSAFLSLNAEQRPGKGND